MQLPILPKEKAYAISNGVFLILLGVLFYTGQWWPGILFVLGFTYVVRQYLLGRRLELLIASLLIMALAVLAWTGYAFSVFIPIFLIAVGLFIIVKESLNFTFKD